MKALLLVLVLLAPSDGASYRQIRYEKWVARAKAGWRQKMAGDWEFIRQAKLAGIHVQILPDQFNNWTPTQIQSLTFFLEQQSGREIILLRRNRLAP